MNIAITGSTGFIGSALKIRLEKAGHSVTRILRQGATQQPQAGAITWKLDDPAALGRQLDGTQAVIHLAGAGISDRRWTAPYKQEILNSRVIGTQSLVKALTGMGQRPELLISASAVGIYGPRGPEPVDENGPLGDDFLAKVCREWEAAAQGARDAGIRVIHPRIGMVLGKAGGALKKMLLPFKLGLGGVIGSGGQFYSWVTIEDLCAAFEFLLAAPGVQGVYNLTAPGSCSNRSYTKALGQALKRPVLFPMPAFAARLAFGEMADALLLSGQNVKPVRLLSEKFKFQSENIEAALKQALA